MIEYWAFCPSCRLVVRWVSTLTHATPFDKEVPRYRIECVSCGPQKPSDKGGIGW